MSARGEFSAPGFRLPVFGLRDSALGAFGLRTGWVDGAGARLVTQLSPSAVSCPIRHGKTPCFEDSIRASAKLSFFLAAFGRFWSRFALSLGLRLGFFHRFLGFGGALGPGFGALFLLFVENLLAAEQFEEGAVGAVAFVPLRTDDAGVPAFAIPEARANGVEQL